MSNFMTDFDSMVSVVKRENNKNRSFLFLNKFQAKYLPTDPQDAIGLFSKLASKIEKIQKKTVVIGFAETATAIGAIVCENIGGDAFYIHSTREDLSGFEKLHFKEEHSHAKNHQLCLEHLQILKECQRFVFVDDEFTTGKTICNFILALKENGVITDDTEVIVTTLINCMKSYENFEHLHVDYKYILAENRDWSMTNWIGEHLPDTKVVAGGEDHYPITRFSGALNTRMGVSMGEYRNHVNKLAENIFHEFVEKQNDENILIMGTEEFMYPAIKIADYIKSKSGKSVTCYATSRSPIAVVDNEDYILKNRSKICSFYERGRDTYLYNLKKYDKVIVVTDAQNICKETLNEFTALLRQFGNENVDIVVWGEG